MDCFARLGALRREPDRHCRLAIIALQASAGVPAPRVGVVSTAVDVDIALEGGMDGDDIGLGDGVGLDNLA